ncbi:hypothetical protein KW850_06135 [Bacillus sp. sid0103]|uniref:hypothetical protein n=1 Tax=Bacillus sp. sid0103 TaxID=2856337 RepID=UPI001C4830EC|nr:hypothetical protein [Bacillus sp. sid0103]MBV7504842.1 hypothetical protein [Bacillus sp. sid0103]
MDFYEKLPTDFLIAFYDEIMKNIEKGLLTKNMYFELGLLISVASQRGITLEQPCDFEQIVDQKDLDDFILLTQNPTKDVSQPTCGL